MAYVDKINVQGTDYDINDKRIGQGADNNALPIFEKITDSAGHKRFIEGDGSGINSTIFDNAFCKWSLSGTHLMCVFAGTLKAGQSVSAYLTFCAFTIPSWILAKIYPIQGALVDLKVATLFDSSYVQTTHKVALDKRENSLSIDEAEGTSIASAEGDRKFRLQFDLLIDNE